jgi:short-subunit dehydrogenase
MLPSRKSSIRPKSVRGVTAQRVAQAAYRGYCKKQREVVVPWSMIPVIRLYQLFPGVVEWGMARAMRNSR